MSELEAMRPPLSPQEWKKVLRWARVGRLVVEQIDEWRDMEEYFDQRADAEYFTDRAGPVGNEEMRHLATIRTMLRAGPTGGEESENAMHRETVRR